VKIIFNPMYWLLDKIGFAVLMSAAFLFIPFHIFVLFVNGHAGKEFLYALGALVGIGSFEGIRRVVMQMLYIRIHEGPVAVRRAKAEQQESERMQRLAGAGMYVPITTYAPITNYVPDATPAPSFNAYSSYDAFNNPDPNVANRPENSATNPNSLHNQRLNEIRRDINDAFMNSGGY